MQIGKCIFLGFLFSSLPQIKNISSPSWFKFLWSFILSSKALDTSWKKQNKLTPFNKTNTGKFLVVDTTEL